MRTTSDHALTRVLLVDDDEETLETLGQALRLFAGANVITANSGQRALECLRRETPTAMVTDYRMPGMNGIDLAAAARTRLPRLPVVIITAFSDEGVYEAARRAGLCGVIRKPMDVNVLIDAVRACYEANT